MGTSGGCAGIRDTGSLIGDSVVVGANDDVGAAAVDGVVSGGAAAVDGADSSAATTVVGAPGAMLAASFAGADDDPPPQAATNPSAPTAAKSAGRPGTIRGAR
ncbi:MAG: hypothetical protein ACO3U0_02385 [Ilumatobacteraceae bacterium]